MSFDTTSVNTGRHTRVCKCLEDKLGREHLWVTCHHHILELILAKVFSLCFGLSNSPEIPLFKRFKANWNEDDRQHLSYLPVKKKLMISNNPQLLSCKEMTFSKSRLEMTTRSLLNSHNSPRHAAHLYSLVSTRQCSSWQMDGEIDLFNKNISVPYKRCSQVDKEKLQLERFVHFGALLYPKSWIFASQATEAPAQDLQL